MEELLRKINESFANCMENSSEETQLQLKILNGNINTLFHEYEKSSMEETPVAMTTEVVVPDKKRILVVDDSSIVRNYLEKLLKEEYDVDMAVDGKDAIDKLSTIESGYTLNAMILDLMMPNIDGFGVLEYLSGKNIHVPVVVISGDNTGETITRAFQYNVVDMIEKPFDSKTIEEKIKRIL